MSDDLSPLRDSQWKSALDSIERLLSQPHRGFLLGAGCSRCAGLPLTTELSAKVTAGASKRTKDVLDSLIARFDGSGTATIEDYMSELVDLLAIVARRQERDAKVCKIDFGCGECDANELGKVLEDIKSQISSSISDCKVDIATHLDFVRAVHRTLRTGKHDKDVSTDYFILNYDTLIEDALGIEQVRAVDGLCGGATGWWDGRHYFFPHTASVYKMHGSIDWCMFPNETLPRRVRPSVIRNRVKVAESVVIWPAATKYRETQLDPYAQILGFFRSHLRPEQNNDMVLAICGYRFSDAHINIELDRAIREPRKALTFLIFTEDEEPTGVLKKWCEDPAVASQVRLHARRGFFHGATKIASKVDLPWWKFEVLTRLLAGER